MILRSNNSTFEPLYVAQDQGYFAEQKLNVTIEAGALDATQNVARVLSGEVELAMTSTPGLIQAVAANIPITGVNAFLSPDPDAPVSDGLLVPPGSDITSILDLEGKTVGTYSTISGGTVSLQALVLREGGDPSTIDFIALPPASLAEAALSGEIDATLMIPPYYTAALADGFLPVGNVAHAVPGYAQSLAFASVEWLEENADIAQRFLAAMDKAMEYTNANLEVVREIDLEYTEAPPEVIAAKILIPYSARFDRAAMETFSDVLYAVGITDRAPSVDELIWSGALPEEG